MTFLFDTGALGVLARQVFAETESFHIRAIDSKARLP
jgi:hypothetical protein